MEKTTTTTTCGDLPLPLLLLPEDFLIQEILVRLPVKSLLRFKSVCKSWFELIQTPFFIDLHTTTTTFNSSSSSSSKFGFILQTIEYSSLVYGAEIKVIKLFKLSSGGGTGEDDKDEGDDDDDDDDQKKKKKKKKMVFKVDDLDFYPFYKDTQMSYTLRMVGSCNGIICLHDPEVMDDHRGRTRQHYSNLRDVCLWNPATRQFRILPKSIPIEEKKYYMGNWLEDFIAFGFDIKTKDYKVLRITPWEEPEEGGCMCRAQVYSLSTDSWRLLEGINSLPFLPNNQYSFHNHGIIDHGYFTLFSFDFTKEIFTTIKFPDDNSSSSSTVLISYLGGGDKMVVCTTPIIPQRIPRINHDGGFEYYHDGYEYYDIWVVLNEQHGSSSSVLVNKESWTKLHSFRINSKKYPQPVGISNNGEFALISTTTYDDGYGRRKELQLFNLVTNEAIKDFTFGNGMCRVSVYEESLVSIMG